MRKYSIFIGVLTFLLISNPFTTAQAYLDPGSGSMFLQLLLGGVTGVVVIVKIYWQRVKNFFGRENSRTSLPPSTD